MPRPVGDVGGRHSALFCRHREQIIRARHAWVSPKRSHTAAGVNSHWGGGRAKEVKRYRLPVMTSVIDEMIYTGR